MWSGLVVVFREDGERGGALWNEKLGGVGS